VRKCSGLDASRRARRMSAPATFDYLRAAPTLEEALLLYRIPKQLQAACRALCCSVLFAMTAWVLEGARLDRAVRSEQLDADRYARQVSALSAQRVYEKRVQFLTDLDKRVRMIAESGTLAARRLAAVSADLPANVWITAITPDADGVMLEGRTRDLNGLSDALLRLNADPLLAKPALLNAQVTAGAAPVGLRFTVHIAATGP